MKVMLSQHATANTLANISIVAHFALTSVGVI